MFRSPCRPKQDCSHSSACSEVVAVFNACPGDPKGLERIWASLAGKETSCSSAGMRWQADPIAPISTRRSRAISALALRAGTQKTAAPPSGGALPRTHNDEQRPISRLGSPTAPVNAFVLSAAYSQPHPSPLRSRPCGSGWQTTRTGPWM